MLESSGSAGGHLTVVTLRAFYFNRVLLEKGATVQLPKVFALEMVTNGHARVVAALPAVMPVVFPAGASPTLAGDDIDPAADDDDDDEIDESEDDGTGAPDTGTDDGGFAGNPLISRRRGRPRKGP
jgi:hypothetical protein